MSRLLAFAIIVHASAAAAGSSSAQVETIVRTAIASTFSPEKFLAVTRADAVVVVGEKEVVIAEVEKDHPENFLPAYWAIEAPKQIAITVDDAHHIAWFQTTTTSKSVDLSGEGCAYRDCKPPKPWPIHVSGLAIDDHGWKLAVFVLGSTRSDRDLIDSAKGEYFMSRDIPGKVELAGDKALAQAAADWLAKRTLGTGASAGNVLASGSAPDEIAADAAARKLAAKWDKLKLAAVKLDAKVFADGVGVVRGEVVWPYKKGVVFGFELVAIAVRDGTTWKWLLLAFS
jgi:hypothetical protein